MHVLQIARISRSDVVEHWSKFGIGTTYVPAATFLEVLTGDERFRERTVDAIALIADGRMPGARNLAADPFESADALNLAEQLRLLPAAVAMADGRKWSAIPIAVLVASTDMSYGFGFPALGAHLSARNIALFSLDAATDFAAHELVKLISDYRQLVLSELDNLGFVVSYEAGRYRLGPALRPRKELAGHYYFGAADQRGDRVVTVDRDMLGIQVEVEQFEALINKPGVREQELQTFFEDHPYFLSLLAQPVPHVRLQDGTGKLLIPDLVLKPLVAARRDSNWEVLELKLPNAKLTAGKGARRRLSHEVWKAITQLREYGSYFADPRNEAQVRAALGHALKRPKLAVLIGRSKDDAIDAVEDQQAYLSDVRIVTYDEILEQQKLLAR